jgi:hypothetical protein
VLLPDTVTAVPISVPPEVQLEGSVPGPNKVKVMVPDGVLTPLDSVAEIDASAMETPAAPADGPLTLKVGDAVATTVSDMPEPQAEVALLLLPSESLNEAYHQ